MPTRQGQTASRPRPRRRVPTSSSASDRGARGGGGGTDASPRGEGTRRHALVRAAGRVYYKATLDADPVLSTAFGGPAKLDAELSSPHAQATREAGRVAREEAKRALAAAARAAPTELPSLDEHILSDLVDDDARMASRDVQRSLLLLPWFNVVTSLVDLFERTQPLDTDADLRRCEARIAALPDALDAFFADVHATSRVQPFPRSVVDDFAGSVDRLLARKPHHKRMKRDAPSLLRPLIDAFDVPLAQHARRLRAEVAPRSRPPTAPGLSHLPNGSSLYARFVRHHTTLRAATPDRLHALGQREVARLEAELRALGPVRKDDERTIPRAHVVAAYRASLRRLHSGDTLAREFGDLRPSEPCDVLPMAEHLEATSPQAFYEESAGDDKGAFRVNLSLPHLARGVDALAYHEAEPGHHFQIQIAKDRGERNAAFRLLCMHTAFEEGWALYAESLPRHGHRRGVLESELLRACRLVVDTGLHARGWSEAAAVAYMRAHAPGMGAEDVRKEVRRYIADPAQALAYAVGLRAFRAVRARVAARASSKSRGEGEGEDDVADPAARKAVQRMHARVLGMGSLPLWLLLEREGVDAKAVL